MKLHTRQDKDSTAGFTLVEIMIVIVIVGILGTMLTSAFLAYSQKQKVYITKARLDQIRTSMQNFLDVNGRYPCPSPLTRVPTDANFGIEGDSDPTNNHSCQTGGATVPIPGTLAVAGANPARGWHVRIGTLPVRTLNLPDEYAVDGWGGLFTYAVDRHQATERLGGGGPGFAHFKGNIRILDENGNSLINPPNSAHYIVLSHGADQSGARVLRSNNAADRVNPCGAGDQSENCDDDAIFTLTSSFYDRGADQNDDIAIFEIQRRQDNVLERGTILAFVSPTCPQGWVDYMNDSQRGRFLMGLDPSGATPRNTIPGVRRPRDPTFVATAWCQAICPGGCPPMCPTPPAIAPVTRGVVTGEYASGGFGEAGEENIPAYTSLRYCVKQ